MLTYHNAKSAEKKSFLLTNYILWVESVQSCKNRLRKIGFSSNIDRLDQEENQYSVNISSMIVCPTF